MTKIETQKMPENSLEELRASLERAHYLRNQLLLDVKDGAAPEEAAKILVRYYNEKIARIEAEISAESIKEKL